MRAAQAGDAGALEALLLSLAPRLARFGRRLCGAGAADVDDAVQEALVAIARGVSGYAGRSSVSSWAFAIARSACHRQRRGLSSRAHEPLDEAAPDPGADPEVAAARAERARAVARALDGLSEEHREVLALRDVEGMSAEEAAEVLGVSVPALKSRLHRARAALRAALAPALTPGAVAPSASCPDVVAALSAKLEDDLAPEACALLEAHVAGCSACSSLCDALKSALAVCGDLGSGSSTTRDLESIVRRAVALAREPSDATP